VRGLIATKAFILWGFMGVELYANVLGIGAALNMLGNKDHKRQRGFQGWCRAAGHGKTLAGKYLSDPGQEVKLCYRVATSVSVAAEVADLPGTK